MPKTPPTSPSTLEREERKRLIAAIIQESPSGRLNGRTRLFKVYWLAHLFYWKHHEGLLTASHGMVHMPNGPGIDKHDDLFFEMVMDGQISLSTRTAGPFEEDVFKSLKRVEVSASTRDSIKRAFRFLNGLNATQISDLAHDYSTSWKDTSSGQPLDIYLDLQSEKTLQENKRLLALAKAQIHDAFARV